MFILDIRRASTAEMVTFEDNHINSLSPGGGIVDEVEWLVKALSRAVTITKTARPLVAAGACLTTMVTTAGAAAPLQPGLDSGATSWVLTASALVLFMTLPGLTLFYGGLVAAGNLAAVLMRRCFVISCVVSLIWLAFG